MTKISKNNSNKENESSPEFSLLQAKFKPRRAASFLNISRKRATQYCTLNRLRKNRRLSLNQIQTKKIIQLSKVENEKTSTDNLFASFASIKNQLKKYAEDFRSRDAMKSLANKKPSFKLMRQKHHHNNPLQDLNMETLCAYDQPLKEYIKNQSNSKLEHQNEELNNKIDLEIRILDGILKLLNAICSTPNLQISSSSQSALNSQSNLNSSSSSSTNVSASALISNLDAVKFDDLNKCSTVGAAIAAAVIANKNSSDSSQNMSENAAFDTNSNEYNHVIQILTACKCLFVSHRKIAIYLQNLHELEKKASKHSNDTLLGDNHNDTSILSALNISTSTVKSSSSSSSSNNNRSLMTESAKLTLSEIRIPLSWKWTDYLKASKNSENVNSKFATFAIIYLGNMIYDTQLLSNIDASVTDISFSESFAFDDVKPNKFEINIEIYAYELYNTANNILQSARKLAKQFTEFATFKRNNTIQSNQPNNVLSQMPHLFNNALTNSSNNYSYSMHKFKLIAKATLNQNDLSDNVETRCLQLINDSGLDQVSIQNGTSTVSFNNQNVSNISVSNRLPLFDYYCCRLKLLPSTSYI